MKYYFRGDFLLSQVGVLIIRFSSLLSKKIVLPKPFLQGAVCRLASGLKEILGKGGIELGCPVFKNWVVSKWLGLKALTLCGRP